jgi:hypothetical protein
MLATLCGERMSAKKRWSSSHTRVVPFGDRFRRTVFAHGCVEPESLLMDDAFHVLGEDRHVLPLSRYRLMHHRPAEDQHAAVPECSPADRCRPRQGEPSFPQRAMTDDYRDEAPSDSIVEAGISTTSRFLAALDLDVAERVAGARCRLPSVSVSDGLMSSEGKATTPSSVTTSPTSNLRSSPRLFAGAPSKIVRRASRRGLSCSLKLSTSTPRGRIDGLSVVRTTEYLAIDRSSERVDRNVLLLRPAR